MELSIEDQSLITIKNSTFSKPNIHSVRHISQINVIATDTLATLPNLSNPMRGNQSHLKAKEEKIFESLSLKKATAANIFSNQRNSIGDQTYKPVHTFEYYD